MTKFDMKNLISQFVKPEYVDLKSTDNFAYIRFLNHTIADKFISEIKKNPGQFKFESQPLEIAKVEKNEEEDYIAHIYELRKNYKKNKTESNSNK